MTSEPTGRDTSRRTGYANQDVAAAMLELSTAFIAARTPNPPGDETAMAQLIAQFADDHDLPAFETHARAAQRPNLSCTLDFGAGGRHLVLSGHIDTKPVGAAGWTRDPFAAELDDGKLYGLGSVDMKCADAAILLAATRLVADPPERGKVTLLFTADEEDGAAYGSHYLSETLGLAADAAVIGEPGGIHGQFDQIQLVSRGILRFWLTAQARQGHSSLSEALALRNAGVDLAAALTTLQSGFRPTVPPNPGDLAGWSATLNSALGFEGGVGFGVLPETMRAKCEVRTLPGMDRDQLVRELREYVAAHAPDGSALSVDPDEPPMDFLPASMVDPAAPIAGAAQRAVESALGHRPPFAVFPGTTDATWFDRGWSVPTLPALGPGLLRQAHGADEYVDFAAACSAVHIYESLARDFCAQTGEQQS